MVKGASFRRELCVSIMLNIFLMAAIVIVIIYMFIVIDIKRTFPSFYNEIGGINILNPFKQINVLVFLISRKYAQNKKIHIYDLFLLNLLILLFLFFAMMIHL